MSGADKRAAGQRWSADAYARDARFVSDLGAVILGWLDPAPGERILDLGCGDGALSERITAAGGEVVGIDTSASFLDAARARKLDVRLMDAQAMTFDKEFDAVFSNAALHWMLEPDAVIDGVFRALRPGGRFVAEFGGFGNVAAVASVLRAIGAAHGVNLHTAAPWFYPTHEHYQAMLETHGFKLVRIELVPRPTLIEAGIEAWLEIFRKPFFDQFDALERTAVLDEVKAALEPALCDDRGRWWVDYVRLRVAAKRPR